MRTHALLTRAHPTPQRLDEDQWACVHTPKGKTRIRAACTCCRFPEDPKGIVGKTKRTFCAVSRSYALVKTENTLGECNCCLERSRNLTGSTISWANSATPTVYAMSPVWGSIFFSSIKWGRQVSPESPSNNIYIYICLHFYKYQNSKKRWSVNDKVIIHIQQTLSTCSAPSARQHHHLLQLEQQAASPRQPSLYHGWTVMLSTLTKVKS